MNNHECTITFGDGRIIHAIVSDLSLSCDTQEYSSLGGDTFVSNSGYRNIELTGIIQDMEYEKPKTEPRIGDMKVMWGDKELEEKTVTLNMLECDKNNLAAILPQYYQGEDAAISLTPTQCAKTITVEFDEEKVTQFKENIMALRDECETMKSCDEDYSGKALARNLRNLELTDEQRLLRKYNLVELDGTITNKGKEFLLNILFDLHESRIVEALGDIESAVDEGVL